jgi:hypothetical protein
VCGVFPAITALCSDVRVEETEMAATIEPAPGSRRLQHFIWAMGEARIRRLDGVPADDLVEGPVLEAPPLTAVPEWATYVSEAEDAQVRGVPPGIDCADFFTEWQPSGPG